MPHIPTRLLAPLTLACAAVLAPASAISAVVEVNLTLDVSTFAFGLNGPVGAPKFTGFTPFSMSVGDQLDLYIDFAGSQTLSITGLEYIFPGFFATSGANQITNMTGQVTLVDLAGVPLYTSDLLTSNEQQVHVGQFFLNPNQFTTNPLPPTVVIGGVRYSGIVNSFTPFSGSDPTITTREFLDPTLAITVTAVPEPSQYLLLLGGLGLVGAVAKRRRSN